jgi:hypothetical protein
LFNDSDTISFDPVTKPSHYNINGGMECIDMIKERLGIDGFVFYCRGSIDKYNHRAPHKNSNPVEDMKKLRQYADYAIKALEEKHR